MATLSDPLHAARSLRPTIRDTRHETEAARCLAPQVVAGLIDTGLCRLAVPASLGGHETEPLVALEVYEELAWADASVAWIAWNNQLVCLASRYSADAVRSELFSNDQHLFANSTRPSGTAVAVDGGFQVSGRWSLVSGCELAAWIPVMCVVTEGNEPRRLASGAPETRMLYVPKGAYSIVDTWYVGGLRGTGSHDIVVDDVFVPTERTYTFRDPDQLDQPLSRMPFFATMAAGCAAMCLGITRAALDTLIELGATKKQVGSMPGLRDRPAVQGMLGATVSALDAARLLLHDALGEVWTACLHGTPVTEVQRARVWGGASHTAKITKAAVTAIYEAAGTSALYVDCPIERAHRDIHAVTQHAVLGAMQLEEAGRVHFGLQPTNPLF